MLLPDCTGAGVHPTRNELAAMVGAGGGQAVPLTQAAQPGAVHLAIVGPQAAASDASIQQLLQAQVRTLPSLFRAGTLRLLHADHHNSLQSTCLSMGVLSRQP